MKVNLELKHYLEKNILPEYLNFDGGHDKRHIEAVLKRSINYYKELKDQYELNINMIYVVACYHDIGMKISRENHAQHSQEILLSDESLKQWFAKEQIIVMSEAVCDHSTSSGRVPRSIYGKIVSDADKDIDVVIGLLRGWEYSLKNFPNLSNDERINEIHKEIVRRFGDESIGGKNLVKFYIKCKENTKFLQKMKQYAFNFDIFKNDFVTILKSKNMI